MVDGMEGEKDLAVYVRAAQDHMGLIMRSGLAVISGKQPVIDAFHV
jgi:hypothetical protein